MKKSFSKANIMIVDDRLDNLRLLSKVLSDQGYKVRGVPDGPSALRAASLAPPDLILLDIKMSEMNGYEVCKRLKTDDLTKDIPVIFLSALDEAVNKVKGFEIGGVDYIAKPFQVEEVLARVEIHLALRGMQKRLEEQNILLQQEIAERKQATDELRASERRLFEIQRIAHLGNWDWNIQTNELFWSDEIYRIFGLQPQEFDATYEAFLHTVHPEDRAYVQQLVNAALYDGDSYRVDHRIVLPDGTVRIVHEQGEVTFDENHRPIRMLGMVQDITEQKRVEEALQKAKEAAEETQRAAEVATHRTQAALRETEGLFKAAQAILDTTEPTDICQSLIRHFNSLVEADRTTLFLVNHQRREILLNMICGSIEGELPMTYEELEMGISGMVFKSGQPVLSLSPDDQIEPEMTRERRLWDNVGSLIVVPLAVKDANGAQVVIGTITAINRLDQRIFTQHEVDLLMALVTHAATAIENVRLFKEAQQEVAERKRAEGALRASEAELRALFAGMTDVVLMLNREGRYLKIAPTSPGLLYKPADEMFGKTLYEVFPKSEADFFLEKINQSLDSQHTVNVEYMLNIDGKEVWFDGRVSPMSKDAVVWVARDITDRKHTVEQMQRAKEAAEAANRAKSVFLANMSHELRTPLNAILGFSQLLLRDPQIATGQRENLETINRSGNHLLALINDVLELSKIEAGRIELQAKAFDLYEMLLGLEEMFRLRAEQQGLSLVFARAPDVPQYVCADQNKLRQVLINILGNAVKFTKEGKIRLRVCELHELKNSKTHKTLHIEIEDTGVGIAPEELDNVFDAFVQTTSGQQSHQGTGLGMPISQQFVRMMGGEIAVSSKVGEGSVFTFDIPVEIVEAADVSTAHPARRVIGLEPGQPVFRILIVEDEQANRRLLITLLQPFGFDLREATNGQEAIAIWQAWHPHLIWMDMRMPVMDGYEATKEIRNLELEMKNSKIPHSQFLIPHCKIIALTAGAFEKQRAEALQIGCDDFVRKPVNEQEIFEKMQKHLGIRYVYEEEKNSKFEIRNSKFEEVLMLAALAALPAEWLKTLKQGARRADFILLSSVIAQIRGQDTRLAGALAQLAEDFEYDEILALIQAKEASEERR